MSHCELIHAGKPWEFERQPCCRDMIPYLERCVYLIIVCVMNMSKHTLTMTCTERKFIVLGFSLKMEALMISFLLCKSMENIGCCPFESRKLYSDIYDFGRDS